MCVLNFRSVAFFVCSGGPVQTNRHTHIYTSELKKTHSYGFWLFFLQFFFQVGILYLFLLGYLVVTIFILYLYPFPHQDVLIHNRPIFSTTLKVDETNFKQYKSDQKVKEAWDKMQKEVGYPNHKDRSVLRYAQRDPILPQSLCSNKFYRVPPCP